MEKARILVIDDESVIRQLLLRTLRDKGYDVEIAEDGNRAMEKINGSIFNLLITDLRMPKIGGMEVLEKIKKTNPYVEVMIITGYPTIEAAVAAIKIGAYDFICKPFDLKEIQHKVELCLERQKQNMNRIQVSELAALFELTKASICVNSEAHLEERILTTALEITSAEHGALYLFDKAGKNLNIVINQSIGGEVSWHNKMKLNEKVLAQWAKKGESMLITNTDKDEQCKDIFLAEEKPKSLIVAPLVSNPLRFEESILGVLVLTQTRSNENFTKRSQLLTSILSGQAATMIKNLELYRELEKKIDALKTSLQELHQTQDQLIQTEKLSSVGQLAFGIAHEIRNPLGIVQGGVDYLGSLLNEKDKEITGAAEKIKKAIVRANNIIVDLLKFSRSSKITLEQVDIPRVIEESLSLLKNKAYLGNVKVKTNFPEDLGLVDGDASLLRQVFFNICNNAVDAMPQGGDLVINVINKNDVSSQEPSIHIEIKDTGEGIPEGVQSKIFVPFFTTKDPGKGTGLGLSIVHMIIERHGGTIRVESDGQKGTTFIIELPQFSISKT
ncbi:MAG: response regulator [Candidatus Omnitrophota bacterium]